MRFSLLGPLEAAGESGPIPLGGINQRATLGYLLLHSNSVVSTNDLVRALWGDAEPATARKMVQNSIAGLRRVLSADPSIQLLTVLPGYVIQVDRDRIDALRFRSMVDQGSADVRAKNWEPAARGLREALGMWRGPVLADLTAMGVADWPVITILTEKRLTAVEDWLEAELALGRHHDVIGELTTLVGLEPVRERLSGLLMLALYRCGRQQEALAVYQRLRDTLRDGFGLDPAPGLREMELAILNQHPSLALTGPMTPPRAFDVMPDLMPRGGAGSPVSPAPERSPGGEPGYSQATARADRADGRADLAGRPAAECKRASIVLVRMRLVEGSDDSESLEEATQRLSGVLFDEARNFGGTVRDSLSSIRSIVFGVPQSREDDPERAIHAALAIRDRLGHRNASWLTVKLAVATGEVTAIYPDELDPTQAQLSGTVLDEVSRLLTHARPGRVRVCGTTARAVGLPLAGQVDTVETDAVEGGLVETDAVEGGVVETDAVEGGVVEAGAVEADGSQEVITLPLVSRPALAPRDILLVGRERELEILQGLLGDVRKRRRLHMVTIFGEPGIGRSRLVTGFIQSQPWPALIGRTPPFAAEPLAPLADSVRSRPGGESLARQIEQLPVDHGVSAWLRHIEQLASSGPVTVVLEDLHLADPALLGHIEGLTERFARLPILIVVTARTEFRERRTSWGCGMRDVSMLTLDPLPFEAMSEFLPDPVDPALLTLVGGNPSYALEYARALREHADGSHGSNGPEEPLQPGALPIPERIRALIAARIDTLPVPERVVLRDAAILRERIRATGIAVLSERDPDKVATVLHGLERKDFLIRQTTGRFGETEGAEADYAFPQPLLGEIARSQVPRRDRIARHRRAIGWIGQLPPRDADLLIHHYQQLVSLTTSTGMAAGVVRRAHRALVDAARRATAAGAHDTAERCRRAVLELPSASSRRSLPPSYEPHAADQAIPI